MPDNDIVIDLNSSNHNRPVGSYNELIQRAAFDALKLQISKDLDKASANARDKAARVEDNGTLDERYSYPHGSGLTYFIDGTRGAGKSTFLSFVYTHLREHLTSRPVEPLLYLDPSRIETSEVVLLHILKHLKRLMENSPDYGRDRGKYQEQFRELFKQMAGGLHLFVSKTESLKDLDPELFLDYGLDRAADSQRLRDLLHQTIDLVCHVYKVSALLLAIDDADTKFAHAIEVLECIRKYLDTPKVVVLVTGDMEMYSLLVQNHFQQDFASNDRGFSPDRKTQQTRMVAHLEEQYLLKLFPIQRRIQLSTLHTLLERTRNQTGVTVKRGRDEIFIIRRVDEKIEVSSSLRAALEDISKNGLRLHSRLDVDLFYEHVLKLPVRSVVQILSTYYQLVTDSPDNESSAAAAALRATALSSLYRYDIDVESTAEGDLHAVIDAAFNLCQLDGEPDTAIYLRPQSRDATLRNAYVSLAADVARLCANDPAKAITYMVCMAGSSSILHLVSRKVAQKPSVRLNVEAPDGDALQIKVKKYLSVGRKDNALNWAWHANVAMMAASTAKGMQLRHGIVRVRTSPRNVGFDAKLAEAASLSSGTFYPVIAFSQSAAKNPTSTLRFLSIFNTLGLISNILDFDITEKNERAMELRRQLSKIQSVHTVSPPNWNDLPPRDSNDPDDQEYEDYDSPPNSFDALILQLTNWLELCDSLKKKFRPSAVLMGKIWNRLYFSVDKISEAMRSKDDKKDGDRCCRAMELFAWALINALLVEEVDYHYNNDSSVGSTLNRYNPNISGDVVIGKFKEANGSLRLTPDVAPLTFMIASCPLVLGLIKHDTEVREFIRSLNGSLKNFGSTHSIPFELLCNTKVWACIGQTRVAE